MSRDTRQINAGDYYDPADYRGRPIEELPGPEQMIHRTLRPSPVHQHAVHDALHGYAEDPAGNLLLVGATGTGKSTQAQAIAATHMRSAWTVPLGAVHDSSEKLTTADLAGYHDCGRPATGRSYPAWFFTFTQLVDLRSSFLSYDERDARVQWVRVAKGSCLLVVDDVYLPESGDRRTSARRELLTEILDYRYAHGLATVMTTNHTSEDVRKGWGDRVFSRLAWTIVPFYGDDYRLGSS